MRDIGLGDGRLQAVRFEFLLAKAPREEATRVLLVSRSMTKAPLSLVSVKITDGLPISVVKRLWFAARKRRVQISTWPRLSLRFVHGKVSHCAATIEFATIPGRKYSLLVSTSRLIRIYPVRIPAKFTAA